MAAAFPSLIPSICETLLDDISGCERRHRNRDYFLTYVRDVVDDLDMLDLDSIGYVDLLFICRT